MKRTVFALLFALLCVAPAAAQWNGSRPGFSNPTTSGCSDTNASAWVSAVVGAGGSVSGAEQTAVCNLIVSLKGHGLFAKADRLWLYASENATQAKIDVINLVSHTLNTTPTFTASQGYTGNGTDYIKTNFVPVTNGVNYVQDSASIGIYVRNNRTVSANVTAIGANDGSSNGAQVQPNAFGGVNAGDINDNAGAGFGTPTGTSQGFYVLTRTASNVRVMYNKGSALGNDSFTSTSLASVPGLYVLGNNNNGTENQSSSDQLAIVWIGGGLNATDNANLSTDINAYMTALGTNVY